MLPLHFITHVWCEEFSILHHYMSIPGTCPVDYMHYTLQGSTNVHWFLLYGDLCWSHCLHFVSLAYHFPSWNSRDMYKLKSIRNLIISEIFSSLHVKLSDISFQKLNNFWVAKALMSSYVLCNILSFQTQITAKLNLTMFFQYFNIRSCLVRSSIKT